MSNLIIPFYDLKPQYEMLKDDIQDRINKVLSHTQFILGPEVEELEEKLAIFSGAKYCITVSSGTEALLISLMALGVGPGDEVITSAFTYAATAEVIAFLGATPVLVDIDLETYNIDHKLIERNITKRTKAIIPVSLYGQPADFTEINAIAYKNGKIPVIEDGAQSFGATYQFEGQPNRKSGNLSLIGCTSFFPSKPLGCYGDGGAIFTNCEEFESICRQIRVHGQKEKYNHSRIGVGGRMDTIQCAILLAKFTKFSEELSLRNKVANNYNNLLQDKFVESFRLPLIKEGRTSVFAQYTLFVKNRDWFSYELKALGIPTSIHYPIPINEQPAYKTIARYSSLPNALLASQHVLSLPFSPYLSPSHQSLIIQAVLNVASRNS
jgi:UDP-2-acetamido-2-deoxy-ribo-hexuluronate aminotransferase